MQEDNLIPKRTTEYYKNHPDIFLEDYYGLSLLPWQKLYIRALICVESLKKRGENKK